MRLAPQICRELLVRMERFKDRETEDVPRRADGGAGLTALEVRGKTPRQLFLTTELSEFASRLAAVHTPLLTSANKKG